MLDYDQASAEKPSRLNKGAQLTARLESVCKIDAEQGALRFDQIQRWFGLLSPDAQKMKEAGMLSAERTRKILRPWIDQGLLAYKVFYVGQRAWLWLTPKGLKFFGIPLRYYEPTPGSNLAHLYAVNNLRLLLAVRRPADEWRSERLLRRDNPKQSHVADAEVVSPNGTVKAIECELKVKNETYRERVVFDLAANKRYNAIWYFVPANVKSAVEAAIHKLPAEHQKRFAFYTLEGEPYSA
ncbi:MAG TPA: hypothetical protein VKV37_04215 [Ktedonobacteraceae bacterium]|nr:hypothetical protein [Ktedonobacteraceae bacterium]